MGQAFTRYPVGSSSWENGSNKEQDRDAEPDGDTESDQCEAMVPSGRMAERPKATVLKKVFESPSRGLTFTPVKSAGKGRLWASFQGAPPRQLRRPERGKAGGASGGAES
jgi:hypothetical protein